MSDSRTDGSAFLGSTSDPGGRRLYGAQAASTVAQAASGVAQTASPVAPAADAEPTYEKPARILEIALSATLLLMLAPAMLLIALLIKITSPGPVLFRQERVGRNRRKRDGRKWNGPERRKLNRFGQPFVIYKFRSMHADARERFPELYRYEHTEEEKRHLPIKVLVGQKEMYRVDPNGENPDQIFTEDPRVSWIGRWLRRSSLDELPNFLNVIKGDMHLVGPRPDIYENIRQYPEHHMKKLDVKPGITGLAQIMGRGRLSFYKTNELDVEYVNNRSFLTDLKIILKTIPAALRGKGAA